jgi:tRNA nucleotidyltransferase (CCA-adding enzyme)
VSVREVDWKALLRAAPSGGRVLEIGEALARAGATPVLVGGAVRDGLIGVPVKDLDVEVFGLALRQLEAELRRFGKVLAVGRAFGVLRVAGLDVDFSLPRRDSKTAAGHRGFDVELDPTLPFVEASRRRDLTVNSIGVDLRSGALLDPHGGCRDLEMGVLRATDPRFFPDDPLRGLRVAQFYARFDLTPTPKLVALCSTLDLSELPGERLWGEFRKLLCRGEKPSRGLSFLRDAKLLRFFPELAALIDVPQDAEWHPEGDVWLHTLMVVDCAARLRDEAPDESNIDSEVLMFGALCHDLGKPDTTEDVDGRIRSLGHDRGGVEPTLAFLDRLRASNDLKNKVAAIVAHHLAPALYVKNGAKARGYRRLARELAAVGLSLRSLERVARADHLGRTTDEALRGEFPAGDEFLRRAGELLVEHEGPRDVVLGRHLIARGLSPSPRFGEILERCRELQDQTGASDPAWILGRVLDGETPEPSSD